MSKTDDDLTPMMRQYLTIKERCGDAILMFRLGDFYEMFEEDAKIASRVLDVTLTKKPVGGGKTVPLAGIPYHALNNYLFKLTRAGYRVAVCEQTEDPKLTKKLVQRDIVRTVTPGTLIESEGMEGHENNYIAAIHDGGHEGIGFAAADISTGEFRAAAFETGRGGAFQESAELQSELAKLSPSEILAPPHIRGDESFLAPLLKRGGCILTHRPAEDFDAAEAASFLEEEEPGSVGDAGTFEPFSLLEVRLAESAAGAVIRYLKETHKGNGLSSLRLRFYRPAQHLGLDAATERNLELVRNLRDGGRRGSLLSVLDRTETAMGARELKQWILRPLLNLPEIRRRQDGVAAMLARPSSAEAFAEGLKSVRDIERLLTRIVYGTAGPRDLKSLEISLEAVPTLSRCLADLAAQAGSASEWFQPLDDLAEVRERLASALVDEPPANDRDGGIFRTGFDSELDEIRGIGKGGKDWILELQARERERTGIPSLKVSYNKVFGYYIEITNAHQEKVPPEYIRKQTLVSAERYITPDLKDYETKVLSAQERIVEIERRLFQQLVAETALEADRLKSLARAIARLDALGSLARTAAEGGWRRPVVNDGDRIEIVAGRHPTLEQSAAVDRFVPNDVLLDSETHQLILITGPNMGGKSTYLRQTALLVLLAQMGSYVPAASAHIGLVDRIFSRVGASDNLFEGQSTFMVEMSESASILKNATPKSLVILDEIGRGTATYDGIGLAWAIAEYLLKIGRAGVKTLFATHYHEMADLADRYDRVKNYHALVAEENGKVTFLYQIAPGAGDHSYGIHVAELAGIPKQVTRRAERVLSQLESGDFHRRPVAADAEGGVQLSLFSLVDEPLAAQLRKLKPEEMSPLEALQILDDLVRQARGEG